jgi:diguanylate cyclase (GGDEF)-like protein
VSAETWPARTLAETWAELWQAPEQQTRGFGRTGELLAARVRIAIVLLLVAIPLKSVLVAPALLDNWIGLGDATIALLLGIGLYRLAAMSEPPEWLGLASCLTDVTLVSVGNAGFLLAGHPLTATNSNVHFTVYLLALSGSCLRNDPRLCLVSGVAAVLQYAGIVAWAQRGWDLGRIVSPDYGTFSWDTQIGRVLLLGIAATLDAVLVARARNHWRLANHDRLTGLFNRRYFEETLAQELEVVRRSSRPTTVVLADVDHFKSINDRYGHAAGDVALHALGQRLQQHFRKSDVVARYGGEEFAAVLRDSVAAQARLEQLRTCQEAAVLVLSEGTEVRFTISMGLAQFPADGRSAEHLLACADRRLYEAKRQGRNRLISAG